MIRYLSPESINLAIHCSIYHETSKWQLWDIVMISRVYDLCSCIQPFTNYQSSAVIQIFNIAFPLSTVCFPYNTIYTFKRSWLCCFMIRYHGLSPESINLAIHCSIYHETSKWQLWDIVIISRVHDLCSCSQQFTHYQSSAVIQIFNIKFLLNTVWFPCNTIYFLKHSRKTWYGLPKESSNYCGLKLWSRYYFCHCCPMDLFITGDHL